MSAQETVEQGLQIAEVQNIISTAPATLSQNRESQSKALAFADNLIRNSQEVGMNQQLDLQMAEFITRGKATIILMNDRRKPFTQMVDRLKKEFTSIESVVKAKVDELQVIRDSYATQQMELQKAKEREAELKLAKEREAIDLTQQATTQICDAFLDHLQEAKQLLLSSFNEATLGTLDAVCAEIGKTKYSLTTEVYRTFYSPLSAKFHTPNEAMQIVGKVANGLFSKHCSDYSTELMLYNSELFDKKESKRAELERAEKARIEDEAAKKAIAEAKDAEEKARLEAIAEEKAKEEAQLKVEQEERERIEKERLEQEAIAAKEKAASQAAVEASAETAAAMVDTAAEVSTSALEVKEGYSIKLKNVAGNLLIAQMWFENEGKNLPQAKVDKFTFERMRKYCEAHALKTGEFISSPIVEYVPVYKAK
ncbi:MAG: hypothetical protein ACRCZB_06000 [Bacteroidales bacterium]